MQAEGASGQPEGIKRAEAALAVGTKKAPDTEASGAKCNEYLPITFKAPIPALVLGSVAFISRHRYASDSS